MKIYFIAVVLLLILVVDVATGYLAFAPVFAAEPHIPPHRTRINVQGRLFASKHSHQLDVDDKRVNDLHSELTAAGLGLCHGILHASGVRCISDLKMLTPDHIAEIELDSFDRRVILNVIDNLNKISDPASSALMPDNDNGKFITTLDMDAFGLLGETATPQNFAIKALSDEHHVYKGRLFTEEQCRQINLMAESHAYKGIGKVGHGWTSQLYTLTDQHMQCKDVPGLLASTKHIFEELLEQELYSLFPGRIRKGSIRFESMEEPHLVRYSGKAQGTKLHMDNSEFLSITINALLSSPDDFQGGGTYIKACDKTIHLNQGEMLIHLGDLEHAGVDIRNGVRRLLVAFLKCDWEEEDDEPILNVT
jgi:hypothetical protein